MGYNGALQSGYAAWRHQAIGALRDLGAPVQSILRELEEYKDGPYFFASSAQQILGALNAARAIVSRQPRTSTTPTPTQHLSGTESQTSSRVFIVHGRDAALLQQVARFVETLALQPIVLFEQPGKGRTLVEKLETESDVVFAIILLTPDDVGGLPGTELRPRARQNVVLELGFFLAKVGRSQVAVLYDESVELPSDYRGVEYIPVDVQGAWKLKLAREMKEAGLAVDMNRAL